MRNKPPTKFKTEKGEIDLSQDIPIGKQTWRERLVLVSAVPHRLVGILDEGAEIKPGFKLYASLLYIAELSFSPIVEMEEVPTDPKNPDGPKKRQPMMDQGQPRIIGMRGGANLHALVPYDFIGTPTIEVNSWEYVIRVADQDDGFKEWMYREYLAFFDPPRVQLVKG
jgi:hypothetical protein